MSACTNITSTSHAVRCASRVTWPLSSHPTPPINVALRTDVSVHEHYINIACSALCITRNMTVIIPPHPAPPHETLIYVVKNAQKHAVPMGKAHKKVRVYRSTEPPTNVTGGGVLLESVPWPSSAPPSNRASKRVTSWALAGRKDGSNGIGLAEKNKTLMNSTAILNPNYQLVFND